jgi:hypothetical protein
MAHALAPSIVGNLEGLGERAGRVPKFQLIHSPLMAPISSILFA